jgi:lambda repressor-like predicted transcriptional regulator
MKKYKKFKGSALDKSLDIPNKSDAIIAQSLVSQQGRTGSEANTLDQSRIRSLLIKGFTIDEVKKMTKLDDKQIKLIAETVQGGDINQGSIDLYTELQRDLSKLVLLETQDGDKRDTNAILSAIKLQAELQEKKIQLDLAMKGKNFNPEKANSDYINTRDKEVLEMKNKGKTVQEIAKELGMSPSSVNQSLDRATFNLPTDLIGVSPSLITETRGLGKALRLDILRKAKEEKMNRPQVRSWINKLKNMGG